MANTNTKKENKIWQIINLKQVTKRWKGMSLKQKNVFSGSDSDSDSSDDLASPSGSAHRNIPSGFLAVYVGEIRLRFLIPTRFLNLPIFTYLLKIAEEEYGFKFSGGIGLPCEVEFFKRVLKIFEENEKKYGNLELHDFLKLIREKVFDSSSCKDDNHSLQSFMPNLLNKTRV